MKKVYVGKLNSCKYSSFFEELDSFISKKKFCFLKDLSYPKMVSHYKPETCHEDIFCTNQYYLPLEEMTLFLNNVESFLHPVEQKDFMEKLLQFCEENNIDLVCTTNSPYIVDAFQPNEVLICRNDEVFNIGNHHMVEKWSKVMTTGEIWSFLSPD